MASKSEYVSVMDKIRDLIRIPKYPDLEGIPTRSERSRRYYKQPGRGHNHDICDSCQEGGDLLCCDNCPASFHLVCCYPPLEEERIPDGEWRCKKCIAENVEKEKAKKKVSKETKKGKKPERQTPKTNRCLREIFQDLQQKILKTNPTTFALPDEWMNVIPLPGDDKATCRVTRSRPKRKTTTKKLSSTDSSPTYKTCFICRKRDQVQNVIPCDFCSECFHRDCLTPPLTVRPPKDVEWMCPLHAEHFIDDVLVMDGSLTKRLEYRKRFCGPVNHVEVMQKCMTRSAHLKRFPYVTRPKRKAPPANDEQKTTEIVPIAVGEVYPPVLTFKKTSHLLKEKPLDMLCRAATVVEESNILYQLALFCVEHEKNEDIKRIEENKRLKIESDQMKDMLTIAKELGVSDTASIKTMSDEAKVLLHEAATYFEKCQSNASEENNAPVLNNEPPVDDLYVSNEVNMDLNENAKFAIDELKSVDQLNSGPNEEVADIRPVRREGDWFTVVDDTKSLLILNNEVTELKRSIVQEGQDEPPILFIQEMEEIERRFSITDNERKIRNLLSVPNEIMEPGQTYEFITWKNALVRYLRTTLKTMTCFNMSCTSQTLLEKLLKQLTLLTGDTQWLAEIQPTEHSRNLYPEVVVTNRTNDISVRTAQKSTSSDRDVKNAKEMESHGRPVKSETIRRKKTSLSQILGMSSPPPNSRMHREKKKQNEKSTSNGADPSL